MYNALWKRPGLNPGPWVYRWSAVATALHAQLLHVLYLLVIKCFMDIKVASVFG